MNTYKLDLTSKSLGIAVRGARQEINYTIGDLAETSGLAVGEIIEIEAGLCRDQNKLHRIATALSMPKDMFV